MKFIAIILVAALAILITISLLSSCSNDLDINVPDDWFIGVIYTQANLSDSYFRLYDYEFNIIEEILIDFSSITRIGKQTRIYNQYYLSTPSSQAGIGIAAHRLALTINLETFETRKFTIDDIPLQDIVMYENDIYTIGNLDSNTKIIKYNIIDDTKNDLMFEREIIMTFDIIDNYMCFVGESFNDENFGGMTFYVVDLDKFKIIDSINMGNNPFRPSNMIIHDDMVYFAMFDEAANSYLVTVDIKSKDYKKIKLDFSYPSSIRFYDGKFYIISRSSNQLLIYDIATKSHNIHTLDVFYHDVIIHNENMYLFSYDFKSIYILSLSDISITNMVDIFHAKKEHFPQEIFINPKKK